MRPGQRSALRHRAKATAPPPHPKGVGTRPVPVWNPGVVRRQFVNCSTRPRSAGNAAVISAGTILIGGG